MAWNGATLTLDLVNDLGGSVDLVELRTAIEGVVTPEVFTFSMKDGIVTGVFDSEPDQAEKGAADAKVAEHAFDALKRVKLEKDTKFDERTEELIVQGFQHNGRLFSTSSNAQSKWHAMFNMNSIGQVSYPLSISDKDELSYDIADSAELITIYGTMVGTGKAHHDSGKALKDTVNAITNDQGQPDVPPNYHSLADAIAAVNAVEDPR